MEDYDTPDGFAEEIEASTRKKKRTRGGQNKNKKTKCNLDKIKTLIDEPQKRSCLWDIFDKKYHNGEKRDVAYTEPETFLRMLDKTSKRK